MILRSLMFRGGRMDDAVIVDLGKDWLCSLG